MRRPLRRFSRVQVEELWRRWKQRETLVAIGAALACSPLSVYGVVRARGGIAPAPRRRAAWALTGAEREEISRGIAAERSVRAMARALGRPPSTISREIRRHGGRTHDRATRADASAWRRARRPKPCRLRTHARLRHVVAAKLRANWSPEQIAAWLKCAYPHDGTMRLSHETIYRTLYVQARGALKHELVRHLRRQHAVRRPRGARQSPGHARIVGAISIAERPPTATDRAVPGHWEGDLLLGTPRAGIVTLVERHSRYVLLLKPRGRTTEPVVDALIRGVRRLPAHLWRSLTWDRGSRWPIMRASPWRPTSRCSSAIRRVPGSAAPGRTRTASSPILSQGEGSRAGHPATIGPGRPPAQHPATRDVRLAYPCRGPCEHCYCCTHRLRRRPLQLQFLCESLCHVSVSSVIKLSRLVARWTATRVPPRPPLVEHRALST